MMNIIIGNVLPTLQNLRNWLSQELINALVLICVGMAIYYLFKQKIGRMIAFLLLAAFVFFFIGNPELVLEAIGNVVKMIFGA